MVSGAKLASNVGNFCVGIALYFTTIYSYQSSGGILTVQNSSAFNALSTKYQTQAVFDIVTMGFAGLRLFFGLFMSDLRLLNMGLATMGFVSCVITTSIRSDNMKGSSINFAFVFGWISALL